MKSMIPSLMDTDFYSFTMCQLAFHNCKDKHAKYKYKCRNGTGFPENMSSERKVAFVDLMNKQLDYFCELRFEEEEIVHLRKTGYFQEDFLRFLRDLQLKRKHISCWLDSGRLHIEINGPIQQTIWFETAVLAINSEMQSRAYYLDAHKDFNSRSIYAMHGGKEYDEALEVARERLMEKIYQINKTDLPGFNIIDFGTRRRFSLEWHDEVLERLKTHVPHVLKGTSNCYLAMKHDLPMIGTMAHQVFQMYQQLTTVENSQVAALKAWRNEYGNKLQIALSDIFGFHAFLNDFNCLDFPETYSGVRHDSGNPYIWCKDLIYFYRKLGISPESKLAVFSDGLSIKKALSLYATFSNRIKVACAIGTNLTNDTITKAPQIVIKLVEFDYGPTAKIADTTGKGMCEDREFEEYVNSIARDKELSLAEYITIHR